MRPDVDGRERWTGRWSDWLGGWLIAVDGRLWCLGGSTGELALDRRSAGDLLTSLFLVGGRLLDEVDEGVGEGACKLDDGDDEKDSDSLRNHLRGADGRIGEGRSLG